MARAGLAELNDPLVLDLDGDGLTLSALTSSHAYFDLSGSGFAVHTGWVAGGDGYTDGGELKTLAQLGITEFGLTTTAANTNINGNTLVETATAVVNGQTRTVGEVLLDTDPSNTVYDGDLDALKWQAMTLPSLRGYGTVADLTIAMSNDDNLLSMMQDLTAGAGLRRTRLRL